MSYFKKFDGCYAFDDVLGCWDITDKSKELSNEDWCDLLEYVNSLNKKIIERLTPSLKNVSTSDVVLAKNFNRKLDKSNVCLRVSNNLIQDYKKFAGELDVPAQDLMTYVLEFGLTHYRAIKEI